MRSIIRFSLVFLLILFKGLSQTQAQNVTVSGAVSGNGGYATLSSAFSAINAGTQTGANILITINASFTETASAVLNGGAWTSVTIRPASGVAATITGTSTISPLIDLNGADYVTIDGLNSGGSSLTIESPNTGTSAVTIRFINDATNNIITRCTVRGSSTGTISVSTDGAVILFSTSSVSSGNDNNTISYCDIGPSGSNLPYICIRGFGTAGRSNDNNIIDNNFIRDFGHLAQGGSNNTNGIYLSSYNSGWTIANNRIYQTATRTFTIGGQGAYRGIRLVTGADLNSGGFTISNNIIGYGNSSGTGTTTIDNSGNFATTFEAIAVEQGSNGATTQITGNTISGITMHSARAPTTFSGLNDFAFAGIIVGNGSFNISNNTIGASSGTGAITSHCKQTTAASMPTVAGIVTFGTGTYTISYNTIGAIDLRQHTSGTMQTQIFAGIRTGAGGNHTISNNKIGHDNANNITSDQNGGTLFGIYLGGSGTPSVLSNTIQNFNHTSANTGTNASASVIGIYAAGSATYSISQNRIFNLRNASSGNCHVYGMLLNQSGSGHSVSRNLIYSLSVNAASPNGTLSGIRILQGSVTISNNMVSLGSGISNNPAMNCMEINGGSPNLYFNSFVITGSATGSASNTYALNVQSGSPSYNVQNNILYNERTTADNTRNRAVHVASTTQLGYITTMDYNNLWISSANTVLGSVGTTNYGTLALWQGGTGRDINSKNTQPTFTNVASDLHISPLNCALISTGTSIAGITIDYDNETRLSPPDIGADQVNTTTTWTGTISSDWHNGQNWSFGLVPVASTNVVIAAGAPFMPVISLANADCRSLTINAGASLTVSNNRVLNIYATCNNVAWTNNGSFTAGTNNEEVIFQGSPPYTVTISGTSVTTFNRLTLNVGALITTTPVISKQLQLNTNSYVNNPVTYGSSSTLVYNTGGTYGVSQEWTGSTTTAGFGTPNHVTIQNTTTVNMPVAARGLAGNLNISSGTFNMLGDLYIGGNWTRSAASGTFIHNCRAVFFTNTSADQTVTVSGSGTETFSYVRIDKAGRKLLLGNNTDMKIQVTAACGYGWDYLEITNGDIDLQGRTLYLEGPLTYAGTGVKFMNLNVKNGTRTISSSVAGGVVDVRSTLNNKTVLVVDGGGSGRIVFGSNTEVRVATGEIDFGTGNLGTIQHILRINGGGAVVGNAAYYTNGSRLIFSTGTIYEIVATQQVWETGTLSTQPGVPWDVEINAAGTDVRLMDNLDHAVRNDLTITAGTLQPAFPPFTSGNLIIGGDWFRNHSTGTFTPNTCRVIFNSDINAVTQVQTITVTGSGNSELYYDLETNNALGITLTGCNAQVSNHLYLTRGLVNTGSHEVYVTTSTPASISFDPSNGSADSWINGNLRRRITTGYYSFPVGTSATTAAAGYQLIEFNFQTNANVHNLRVNFTIDNTSSNTNEPYAVVVNGSTIVDRLNSGWWTAIPYDASLNIVGSPSVSFNPYLNIRGYTNGQPNPQQYAVIKRNANHCYDPCSTPWTDCGTHSNLTQWEVGGTVHAERSGFGCTSFSDWAIGFAPYPLPVELTTFTVEAHDEHALLSWQTSTELNSDFFAIERSTDGYHFMTVATVKSAGHSLIPVSYSYLDLNALLLPAPLIYYRLRMVDQDQSYQFSPVNYVATRTNESTLQATVYPNPFDHLPTIQVDSETAAPITVRLFDVAGRLIYEAPYSLTAGHNEIVLPATLNLHSGTYLLHLSTPEQVSTYKLVRR
ncbi:MAG: T9SS type A sorting domain-containing protein [Chitinophagales bacterium]|nr:T9SS type A sorting domain-containing protein [Chitinophagales bacterium]MDW8393776.1 T9SS type A sorting domain-containing protein [Chitinophagales bacterium]